MSDNGKNIIITEEEIVSLYHAVAVLKCEIKTYCDQKLQDQLFKAIDNIEGLINKTKS